MADASDHSRGIRGPKAAKVKYPGGEKAKALEMDIQALKDKWGPELVQITVGTDGTSDGLSQTLPQQSDEEYPVKLYAPDQYDTMVQMKRDLIGSDRGDKTPFGQATLTTDDLQWMARKRAQMTAAEFKIFVAGLYNSHDPAQQALLKKVYPELLDEQKAIIEERAELCKRLAIMRLHGGPQDKDDLRLLFALNSGAISLPQGDLWRPTSWNPTPTVGSSGTSTASMIARGIFSPQLGYRKNVTDTTKIPFDALSGIMGGSSNIQGGDSRTLNSIKTNAGLSILPGF